MAKATHRAETMDAADDLAPAPPALLTLIYGFFALTLFAAFAYTLWSNQHDPGRAYAWIVKARMLLSGH